MSNNPIIPKVWVTKYALTEGILTYENVEHCVSTSEGMIAILDGSGWKTTFHGNDWHRTEEEALARARDMVVKKRGSMWRQSEKLRHLEAAFEAGRLKP